MIEPRPWHRLFGLSWMDFFQGTDVDVETELDLSIKQQFLDLVLIRKGPRPIPRRLPDGFEQLAAHNLMTFKSYQETLNELGDLGVDRPLCELPQAVQSFLARVVAGNGLPTVRGVPDFLNNWQSSSSWRR